MQPMQPIGGLLKQRFDQIVIQNQMLKAGCASLPYMVMRDKALSLGARLTYAFLLMYAWQEGSTFAGQVKMASDMGVSERHLRRYLTELKNTGYIAVERHDKRYNNTYVLLDKPLTKLRAKAKPTPKMPNVERDRTPVSGLSGHR
jgi:hypothetical protein